MKIAFCISGLFKPSTTHSAAYENKFAYLTEKIKEYKADTFIYSFSKEIESEVVNIFEPKDFKFEVQKEFEDKVANINSILDKGTAKRVFSMFYSRKKVCELRKKFEKENKTNYDVVVLCRPDLGYVSTENFKIPNLHEIDADYLYSMYWNQFNAGMPDWFFISNPQNIDFLSRIYDKLPLYLKHNSDYKKSITSGFPYSNSENRFSQEIFNKSPRHSEKIDEIYMLNQHVLLKYYLLENDKFSLDFLKFSDH
tara:strand:- start:10868 stop:11626 length:759 start_codon:yes stop_codon:yes gene_type:complete